MYSLDLHAYCGMRHPLGDNLDRQEGRDAAARALRRSRRRGFPVAVLARGVSWEILEPADAVMVPDTCGTLDLEHRQYICPECGYAHDTADGAAGCCAND